MLSAPPRSPERRTASLATRLLFVPVLAVTAALAVLLPVPLVLPALSTLAVLAGFTLAGTLYMAGFRIEQGPAAAWSAAGALVFLGFAAGILADGEEALAVLERLEASTFGIAAR